MRALRPLLAVVVLGATGCAAQVALTEPFEASAAREDARVKTDELMELERTVAAAIEDPGACAETLCPGAARICELSTAICGIAARHAGDRELDARCADGERRCGRARERVGAVCGCE